MAFSKVLVANRGEIACRVIRSARALGYATVAVFSEADAGAPHVRLADEAVCIGPAAVNESYLSIERVLQAAGEVGADAIHPGYGFLSERADFAQACAWAGVVFVGPTPEAIELMGDKARAKAHLAGTEVPCLPGYAGEEQSLEALVAAAADVGFPLLVKAAAGGGGRGMRRVDEASELEAALLAARSEAEHAFGDGRVLLERLVLDARHVEVQVVADQHGAVVHLGERDCSAQRRYQKVVEEAPCPAVDAALRARLGEAAVACARAIDYVGVGTVEMLLAPDGSFSFLEMNTRLQVEHPVTELVTGLDLVELQLRVAAGEPLGLAQEDVVLRGHAIEARLYAEDPADEFAPQTGRLALWEPPAGASSSGAAAADGGGGRSGAGPVAVRVDAGLVSGLEVSAHYDPMLAKVIAWGRDRDEARRRLRAALRETAALGLRHNKGFLLDLLAHPRFVAGEVTTGFLESPQAAALREARPPSARALALAAVLGTSGPPAPSPYAALAPAFERILLERGARYAMRVQRRSSAGFAITLPSGEAVEVLLHDRGPGRVQVSFDWAASFGGARTWARASWADSELHLELNGRSWLFSAEPVAGLAGASGGDSSDAVRAPGDGRVVSVAHEVGQSVEGGEPAVVVEAMKIERTLTYPRAGRVASVAVAPGDAVRRGALLVGLEPINDSTRESGVEAEETS